MSVSLLIVLSSLTLAADDAREAVRCAEIAFAQAAERRDRDAFAALVDADARFVSGRISRGREAVVSAWSRMLTEGGPSIRWRPAVVEVLPSGDLALSRGPYRIRSTDENGQATESWGHFISTWRQGQDGRWQVLFDSGGDHGMTPTDEERALLEADTGCPD